MTAGLVAGTVELVRLAGWVAMPSARSAVTARWPLPVIRAWPVEPIRTALGQVAADAA